MRADEFTVDELEMARSPEQTKEAVKKAILNGDTVSDNDCKVNLKTIINSVEDHLIIELISRIDRTNPAYSKYMTAIDEHTEAAASDLVDKHEMVF